MTVFEVFAQAAARWPDRPMVQVLPETAGIYGIAAGEINYADALREVSEKAALLEAAGYVAGQRVMLLLENRPSYFLWWLALNRLGVSVVPINPDLRAAELAYMFGHAEPVLAIGIEARCADLRAAAFAAGVTCAIMSAEQDIPAVVSRDTIAMRDGAREAALLYTSGTTGNPKGCILTDEYFVEAGLWYAQTGGLCTLNEDGERMITPLPIFHMNAMAYSFMAMLTVGGCLIALDRFHPRSWWDAVRESRATCLHYLGVMPSMLMSPPTLPDDRDHSVRFGFGAGVDPKLHAAFEERFGFPLIEGWAMTETGAGAVICANRVPRRVGESCLGRLEGGIEARVIGEDGAEAVQGELLVRHAGDDPKRGFFAGYFKNPEATAEAWEGGWFHTGDIVRRDADGTFFFVDRKKNVIRRSGENIASVEVESVLARHPGIASVAVAAVPDDLRGDEVFACIVPEAEADAALARQIVAWCLEQLAYYKAPGYVAFVDTLPVTATQKLQRGVLKAMAQDLVGHPNTIDTRALKKRSVA